MIKNVLISNQAKKAIRKLDRPLQNSVAAQIAKLRAGLVEGTAGRGDLRDLYLVRFRHRGQELRIAYRSIGNDIEIILAGQRENFYQRLKRVDP